MFQTFARNTTGAGVQKHAAIRNVGSRNMNPPNAEAGNHHSSCMVAVALLPTYTVTMTSGVIASVMVVAVGSTDARAVS